MTWNGVYIGANGGWGWSDYNFAQVPFSATPVGEITPLALRINADGPLFGGQIGYNWQFHPNWVAGIEGDFDGASIHSSSTAIVPSGFVPALSNNIFSAQEKLQWVASIRGRLGYSLAPGFVGGPMLIYATGGAAWANYSGSALMNAEVAPAVFGQSTFGNVNYTRSGAVVGGGIEWMFAPNWSLKAEYLHYFLSGASTSALPFLNCAIAGCGIAVEHRNSDIDSVRLGLNYQI
jgi:outer membrane immunogenic protein